MAGCYLPPPKKIAPPGTRLPDGAFYCNTRYSTTIIGASERKNGLHTPDTFVAGAAVGRILDELVMGHELQVIIQLQAVGDFQYLFVLVAFALGFFIDVGGGLLIIDGTAENAVGNAQEIILTAGDELQVGYPGSVQRRCSAHRSGQYRCGHRRCRHRTGCIRCWRLRPSCAGCFRHHYRCAGRRG